MTELKNNDLNLPPVEYLNKDAYNRGLEIGRKLEKEESNGSWRPTEEQIAALWGVVEGSTGHNLPVGIKNMLHSLLQDLRKFYKTK